MYNRIAIVGGSGTGKTTLSNILSNIYNLPVIHIDGIHHLPNWKIRDKNERDEIIHSYVQQEKWIIDGTYNQTLKERFERADLIIWLDYSTFMQVKGILKRFFQSKNKERPEIPGCKERLNFKFFKYVLFYRKMKRHFIPDNLEEIPQEKILIFKKQKDLNKWIKELKENKLN